MTKNYFYSKLYMFLIIFSFSILVTNGQEIRNSNWGDTAAEVIKSEKPLIPSKVADDFILYENVSLGMMKSDIKYEFTNKKLTSIRFELRDKNFEYSLLKDNNNLNLDSYIFKVPYTLINYINANEFDCYGWFPENSVKSKNYKEITKEIVGITENYWCTDLYESYNNDVISEIDKVLKDNYVIGLKNYYRNENTRISIYFNLVHYHEKSELERRQKNLRRIISKIESMSRTSTKHYQTKLPLITITFDASFDVKDSLIKDF